MLQQCTYHNNFPSLTPYAQWSSIVGETFEIYMSEMAINELQLSTMIGENFEIFMSEIAINASTMVGQNLEFACLKWL